MSPQKTYFSPSASGEGKGGIDNYKFTRGQKREPIHLGKRSFSAVENL